MRTFLKKVFIETFWQVINLYAFIELFRQVLGDSRWELYDILLLIDHRKFSDFSKLSYKVSSELANYWPISRQANEKHPQSASSPTPRSSEPN